LENGAESTASVEPQRSFALQQELFA